MGLTRMDGWRIAAVCLFAPMLMEGQEQCGLVAKLALAGAKVETAEAVAGTPGYCQVKAVATPTADSRVGFEVWMPVEGWNGLLLQLGNGGLAGSINYPPMKQAVDQHYAVAATDDGHTGAGTDGSWANGHPEKVIDFGYRAVHETSVKAKAIVTAFYGHAAKFAYFNGCSEGGREAMVEAQRFPEDFNGILVGSPAGDWTGLMEGFAWNAQALLKDPASYVPEKKRPAIEAAAVKACGTQMGVTDSFIKDPLTCHFDPSVLLCKGEDADSCLTAPQLAALKKIYAGASSSKGTKLYTGYEPGAEAESGPPGLSYSSYIYGPAAPQTLDLIFSSSFLGSAVFGDPKYSSLGFDFDKDVAAVDAKVGAALNAKNPDLKAFRAHGGKMLQYHGWNDGSPAPRASVEYYRAAVAANGGQKSTEEFFRLYMAPGMMHCGLGPGPNSFGNLTDASGALDPEHNIFSALRSWVEDGRQPDSIVATKFPGDDTSKPAAMTRPLCPFPKQAVWNGKGSTNDAANFSCGLVK